MESGTTGADAGCPCRCTSATLQDLPASLLALATADISDVERTRKVSVSAVGNWRVTENRAFFLLRIIIRTSTELVLFPRCQVPIRSRNFQPFHARFYRRRS